MARLGLTYEELLNGIGSDGLAETTTNTYSGSIRVKDLSPISTPHTAIFTPPNEEDVWLLKKVVIKTVNSLKVGGVAVGEENFSSYPFHVIINNEETCTFSLSTGSVIGEDIEYSVDLECTFEMPLESHRETTRRLVERVKALEEGGGTGTGGSGLVIGETEGTAYDGGKGFAVAADVAQLKIDVENLAGDLEGAVSTVNPMLENHEERISALEESGGSGGSGGSSSGGGMDETALATYLSENRYVQLEEPLTSIADYLSYYYGIEQGVVLITNDNLGSEVERTLYDVLPSVASQYGYCTLTDVYDAISNSATIGAMQESVTTLKGRVDTLDERVTTLEKSGGGGGSSSDSGTKKKYWLESDVQNVFIALEMMATFAHIKVLFEPTDNSIVQNGVYMGSFSDLLLKANVNYIEITEVAGSGFSNLRLERSNDPNNKGFFIKTTYSGTDYEANPFIVNTTLIEM